MSHDTTLPRQTSEQEPERHKVTGKSVGNMDTLLGDRRSGVVPIGELGEGKTISDNQLGLMRFHTSFVMAWPWSGNCISSQQNSHHPVRSTVGRI